MVIVATYHYNVAMRFANITERISPEMASGLDPWEVHELASKKAAAGEDIIMLSIGQEADELTPGVIVNEAVASLHEGNHHYTDVRGSEKLRQSIAGYHTRLTSQVVSAEQCIAYAGAQNALFATAQILLQPGDSVILSEPYYTTYPATFSASGARLLKLPVTAENNYQLDVEAISKLIEKDTRAIVLNSPNNPMGVSYSTEEYQAMIALSEKHDLWLILDAVYMDIVDVSVLALPHNLPGAEERLITIGSLSKSHRMTGWRLGWVVGPQALASHLANLSMCMHYGLPPFIMDAAVVAIEQACETPRIVQQTIARRRKIAAPILSKLTGGNFHDSGQGMFMLLDVSALTINAREFALHLLEHHQVAVLPCDGFGRPGDQLIRIGLCVDDQKLRQACERIATCFDDIHRQM